MKQFLSLSEVIELHRMIIEQSGGAEGIRDLGALHACLMQPYMTFAGVDLYPSISDKASALCYSLVMNHPFIDGNKQIGHAAMESLLVFHGLEIREVVTEQETTILNLASGKLSREEFATWVKSRVVPHLRGKTE